MLCSNTFLILNPNFIFLFFVFFFAFYEKQIVIRNDYFHIIEIRNGISWIFMLYSKVHLQETERYKLNIGKKIVRRCKVCSLYFLLFFEIRDFRWAYKFGWRFKYLISVKIVRKLSSEMKANKKQWKKMKYFFSTYMKTFHRCK